MFSASGAEGESTPVISGGVGLSQAVNPSIVMGSIEMNMFVFFTLLSMQISIINSIGQ